MPCHFLNAISFNFVPNLLTPRMKGGYHKMTPLVLFAKRYRLAEATQVADWLLSCGVYGCSIKPPPPPPHPIHVLNIDWCDSEMYFVSVAFQPDIDASLCRFFTFHRACLYACAVRSLWHMKGFFSQPIMNVTKKKQKSVGNKRTQNSTNCHSFHNYPPTMLGSLEKSWYKSEFLCTNKALSFCLVCNK